LGTTANRPVPENTSNMLLVDATPPSASPMEDDGDDDDEDRDDARRVANPAEGRYQRVPSGRTGGRRFFEE
jgi:hypothetical protein